MPGHVAYPRFRPTIPRVSKVARLLWKDGRGCGSYQPYQQDEQV